MKSFDQSSSQNRKRSNNTPSVGDKNAFQSARDSRVSSSTRLKKNLNQQQIEMLKFKKQLNNPNDSFGLKQNTYKGSSIKENEFSKKKNSALVPTK